MAGLFDDELDIYNSYADEGYDTDAGSPDAAVLDDDSYSGDDYRDTGAETTSEGGATSGGRASETSTFSKVASALPDILTIGVNAYGSVAADKLARAYEKDAKEYVGKAEKTVEANMDYFRNRQSYYDDMLSKSQATNEANAADMNSARDYTLQNALQTERRLNNWTSVFGSTEEALGKYYGNLNEDHVAAFKVNEINEQFSKAKKSLAMTYAQRGLASSGAEAEAMLNLEMTSAHTRAKAIYETRAEVAKQQQEFLNTGYAQQANLVNANSNALNSLNNISTAKANNASSNFSAIGGMTNNNNAMTNSAMQAGSSLYGNIANMNYQQAGTANQAAYQLAQQAAQAASSKKSGGLFGNLVNIGATALGTIYGGPAGGAAAGAVSQSITSNW